MQPFLESLGAEVVMDGTHMGKEIRQHLLESFTKTRMLILIQSILTRSYDGLEDYILISGDSRTPFGMFDEFYSSAYKTGIRHWNKPEGDIINCDVAAIDPYFGDDSDFAVKICVENASIPYVTIDCKYDSYIHKNSAVTVISGESLRTDYPDKTREEIFPLFQENGGGLTIITNGGNDFYYGRKGGEIKTFTPFKVNVVSSLGAGDSFKAGCTYALLKGYSDDEIVRFASACAAIAISRYPLHLNPPTLSEIQELLK